MDPNWIEKFNRLFLDDDDSDSDGDSDNKNEPEMDVENMISFFSGSMPEELLSGRFKSKENAAAANMSNGVEQQPSIDNGPSNSQEPVAAAAAGRSTSPQNSDVEDEMPSPLRLAEASQYSCSISSDEDDEYIPQDYYPVPVPETDADADADAATAATAATATDSTESKKKKKKKKPRQRLRIRNKAFLSSVEVALDVLAMAVANRLHQLGADVNNDEEIAKMVTEVVAEMNFPEHIAEAIAAEATKIYKGTANQSKEQNLKNLEKLNQLINQINQNKSEYEFGDFGNFNAALDPNTHKVISLEINANLFATEEELATFNLIAARKLNAGKSKSKSGAAKKNADKKKADKQKKDSSEFKPFKERSDERRAAKMSERQRLMIELEMGKQIEKQVTKWADAHARQEPKTDGFDMQQFLNDRAARRQKAEEGVDEAQAEAEAGAAEYEFGVNDILANLEKQDEAATGRPRASAVEMVDKSVGTDDDYGVGKEEPKAATPAPPPAAAAPAPAPAAAAAGRRSWFAGPMFMPSAATLKQDLDKKAKDAEKNETAKSQTDYDEEELLLEWYENGEVKSGHVWPLVLGKRNSKK
ncbi:uncharacterized protein LOC111065203 [Drosophila obscura]|uniref:uncharacterized protein LOC111065203 n=1 Tax=Drosophila obscura TaxID=7282 RepID=UPI001BB19596|nr:uncharacterized protein LOC111065203 [Drosophila obscura]